LKDQLLATQIAFEKRVSRKMHMKLQCQTNISAKAWIFFKKRRSNPCPQNQCWMVDNSTWSIF